MEWWSRRGSNPRPPRCHRGAPPTALRPHLTLPGSYNTAKGWGQTLRAIPSLKICETNLIPDDRMTGQIDGDQIRSGLRNRIFADLVETDFQGLGVDGDAQVAIILIVVMFEDQAF